MVNRISASLSAVVAGPSWSTRNVTACSARLNRVSSLLRDRRRVHRRGRARVVGILLTATALSACHAGPATGPPHPSQPTRKAATVTRETSPAPPCPPVRELSHFVGERLHVTGARSAVRAGTVHQRCTYAPSHLDTPGHRMRPRVLTAPFMFRIPAVPRVASVREARVHFSRLIRAAAPRDAFRDATHARTPALGPDAFVLRVPPHNAHAGMCEVVEQNGNGQPIDVTVTAVTGQPHDLGLLCRRTLAAAHMVP